MGKPVTEELSIMVQSAVAGFDEVLKQNPKPGVSMSFEGLTSSANLTGNGFSGVQAGLANMPQQEVGPLR